MKTLIRLLSLFAGCILFGACEKSGSNSTSEGQPSTPGTVNLSTPLDVTTKSGVAMVSLPGGEFTMGSDRANPDEAPAHKVKVSPFLMDTFEVTHEMFAKVQLPDPSHWQDNSKGPVERVRWRDAKAYCNERSRFEGLKPCYDEKTPEWNCDYTASGYRLPTEAEWEYACRAGTEGDFDFGAADKLRQYAWYRRELGAEDPP